MTTAKAASWADVMHLLIEAKNADLREMTERMTLNALAALSETESLTPMANENSRIRWGNEQNWPTTYKEYVEQKQREIDGGGRGRLSADDVKDELRRFQENTTAKEYNNRDCDDCGASMGHLHIPGCDVEECPICGGQLISCGHESEVLSE